jgi:hypothetical protein
MRMVVFVLLAFAFAAQTKPDFSGVWQLNLKRHVPCPSPEGRPG